MSLLTGIYTHITYKDDKAMPNVLSIDVVEGISSLASIDAILRPRSSPSTSSASPYPFLPL